MGRLRNGSFYISAAAVILLGLTGLQPAIAGPNRVFHEDFTSTTFMDTAYTSALWDTVAGEFTLPPFSMTFDDSILTPGLAYGVVVRDRYAYVADLSQGLQVFDVGYPPNAQLAGSYVTPSAAWDLALSGNYAYLACGSIGLYIADISDPTNPVFAASYNTPGFAQQVRIDGNFAYVADGANGLKIIDISDPTAPVNGGTYNSPGGGLGIEVEGNYAYLGDGTSGLRVIDISDPTTPVSAGSVSIAGTSRDIVVAGNVAYVATDLGVQVVDISDPTTPGLMGSFPLSDNVRGIAVEGDFLYIAGNALGVVAVDISSPASPVALDTIDTPGLAWRLFVEDEYAFVADGFGGLRFLNVARQVSLGPVLGGESAPFYCFASDVSGNFAYATDQDIGFRVVDISDPAAPVLVASMATSANSGRSVDVEGDYAYIADYYDDLFVIDVSDPFNPSPAGSLDLAVSGNGRDIDVEGDYAYMAHYSNGLQILDVSDPTAPALVGSLATSDNASSVVVDGDVAYVGLGAAGVIAVDVSDPTNPVSIGSENTIYAGRMVLNGNYLYVVDNFYGLRIVDVSDPTLPTLAGGRELTDGSPLGIAISGRSAVITAADRIYYLRFNTPTYGIVYGEFVGPGQAAFTSVHIEGDYAYISDLNYGLRSFMIFDRSLNQWGSGMTSIMMDTGQDDLVQVRLTTSQVDSLDWRLYTSLIGGNLWDIKPDEWKFTIKQDHYLQWKAYLYIETPNIRPLCSDLTVEWLFNFPVIDSILDIASDQGRSARLSFARSGWDAPGSVTPIREYSVFRKVDPALSKRDAEQSKAEGLPPGAWDFIATIPADGDDQYSVVVPTLKDSTEMSGQYMSTYLVRARTDTPGVYFDSYTDSGYSLDNLSPGVPFGFKVAYAAPGGNGLSWDRSDADDFQYFRVYRDTSSDFTPAPYIMVNATADTAWIDPIAQGRQYHYKVSAVDFSGNESAAAAAGEITGFGENALPKRFDLKQNEPNPFNPTTIIRYYVPAGGGRVVVRVYDLNGRLVSTLVDREESAGEKSVAWNGRNERGEEVSSGVYFYRLEAAAHTVQRKMMLLR